MKLTYFLLCILIFIGCKKSQKINCRYYYYNRPASIVLSTNDTLDFDTLIVNHYKPNDSFNILLFSDTILNVHTIKLDEGYRLLSTKAEIYNGVNKEFVFPNISKSYRVSDVFYGASDYFEVMEDGCLSRTFLRGPESVKINGTIIAAGKDKHNDPIVILTK